MPAPGNSYRRFPGSYVVPTNSSRPLRESRGNKER